MNKVKLIYDSKDNVGEGLILCPGINLYTGSMEFVKEFGNLSSLEEDVLNVGAAIFGSDIGIKRGEQESIVRSIELTIPVVNLPKFKQVSEDISYALYILSHDAWTINFIQKPGIPEPISLSNPKSNGTVLLFSGGLDSFAASIKLANSVDKIHLVSHVTANPLLLRTQKELFEYLCVEYPDRFNRNSFRVSGIDKPTKGLFFPHDKDREETQRTRSFMFLSLAGLVARRRLVNDIVMIAENGQMAIHLPLTAGRISTFSTHTAHPDFINLMSKILSILLSYEIDIHNPFLYLTKAEVIKGIFPSHQTKIIQTVSCWKASRVSKFNHCGICIPCLVRRIALEHNKYPLNEYAVDLFNLPISGLPPDNDGKRNLVELCEFISTFSKKLPRAFMENQYPELVSESFDVEKTILMYQRFSDEAIGVFQNYPNVLALMR
jgi:7-cyano-7-deazaguanine synthase in queuosine biosynthesis